MLLNEKINETHPDKVKGYPNGRISVDGCPSDYPETRKAPKLCEKLPCTNFSVHCDDCWEQKWKRRYAEK